MLSKMEALLLTMIPKPEFDVDAELQAWHEAQGTPVLYQPEPHLRHHRCPVDMPPCPECQEAEEEEDFREYYDQ